MVLLLFGFIDSRRDFGVRVGRVGTWLKFIFFSEKVNWGREIVCVYVLSFVGLYRLGMGRAGSVER